MDTGTDKRARVSEPSFSEIRRRVVGVEERVPLIGGRRVKYVNFDNAASTPPLRVVLEAVEAFMPWYSSVHRGSGYKSRVATRAYDDARRMVGEFFDADPAEYVTIFGKNTTEAINKLSYRLGLSKDDVVLVSMLEHHSNDLPWRKQARVEHIAVKEDGALDEADFDRLLAEHGERVKLVAVSGGSNVTGELPPIRSLARKTHAVGARILVDGAQLAPHRAVTMGEVSDPEHLDYIAISAHKLYAPFGTGALIGRRDTFMTGAPELCGGGTIDLVTEDEVEWTAPPEREEAGSPNVVGAVALAVALRELGAIGMEAVAEHEARLTVYALQRIGEIPGVKVYGDPDPARVADRLGVIPLQVGEMAPALAAAILAAEWGIGVRSGCFCAHPYVAKLLDLSETQMNELREAVRRDDRSRMPGFVRVSFGLYNAETEVDRLALALRAVAAGKIRGTYHLDTKTGDYEAVGWAREAYPFSL